MRHLLDIVFQHARAMFRQGAMERDLAREVAYHYDRQVAENLAAGMDAGEAQRQARLSLGGVEQVREQCRDERGFHALEETLRDLRYACRALARSPGFTAVALLSLALGIGANTAIFSFLNTLLLKTLPVHEPARLVRVVRVRAGTGEDETRFNYPSFRELSRQSRSFSSLLAWVAQPVTLATDDGAGRVRAEVVSGSYFRTLGVRPAIGRVLAERDDGAEDANPVCVISDRLWRTRFSSDPTILGRRIALDHHPYQIVGVTEEGFEGASLNGRADLQVPMSMVAQFLGDRRDYPGWTWLQVIGRLKPGVEPARAEAELQAIGHRLDAAGLSQGPWKRDDPFRVRPAPQGFDVQRARFVTPVAVLMAAVTVLLLIACLNIAGLLLARASVRRREIAIRLSLGAARARIVRQLLTESVLLSILGGLAGFAVSLVLTRTLADYFAGGEFGLALRLKPDVTVVAFTLGVSVLTGILFGLAPALQATRPDVVAAMRGGGAGGARASRLRRGLIVAQVTLSVMLLFGAGLLQRSLLNLKTVDLGFSPERIVTATLAPEASGYDEAGADQFAGRLLARVRATPGMRASSLSYVGTLSGKMFAAFVQVPGRPSGGPDLNDRFNVVSSGYFRTLGIPLLAGRDFAGSDLGRNSTAVIVNRRFARHYWPGLDPIGRRFKTMGGEKEVVGLVGDAKYQSVQEEPPRTVYVPMKPGWAGQFTLQARTDGDASRAVALLREAVRGVDPRVPLYDAMTLETRRDNLIATERALGLLSELFGTLALLLCAIGLYGLVAYWVSSRRREIGVRVAVGAAPATVVRLFLRESVALAALGLLLGAPLALVSARAMKNVLYRVSPADAGTLAAAALVLFVAMVLAAYLPSRKAARLDAVAVLRTD